MQLSVGTLFAAAVGPGMLLAATYIIYPKSGSCLFQKN
jgi:TRAP-type mannitol/chloroaromatic compound transport system permease large subunit